MAKKRQFHCEKCGNPCEIYKKGKSHRVLVCPECGILATNPLPLAGLAVGLGLKAVKKAGKAVGIGKGKAEKKEGEMPSITKHYEYNIDTYTAQERVRDALK